jgi:uncharacterized membrane protein YfcA
VSTYKSERFNYFTIRNVNPDTPYHIVSFVAIFAAVNVLLFHRVDLSFIRFFFPNFLIIIEIYALLGTNFIKSHRNNQQFYSDFYRWSCVNRVPFVQ